MDKDVFSDARVGAFFEKHFVSLKLNEETPEGRRVKKHYDLTGLPGYGFISGDGDIIFRSAGYKNADEFLNLARQALEAARDTNNLGRLEARYSREKNDERYLLCYLEALKKNKATRYTDVLEHFLNMQKGIAPGSPEMIGFLTAHHKQLVFGGRADSIIEENRYTAWKPFLKEDPRAWNQDLLQTMFKSTLRYAVHCRDGSRVDLLIDRVSQTDMKFSREEVYADFYLNAGFGEEYKALVFPRVDSLYHGIDVRKVLADDERVRFAYEKAHQEGTRIVYYGDKLGDMLSLYAINYGHFADAPGELKTALSWSERATLIAPSKSGVWSNHADLLYLSGEKEKAIGMKEKAYQMADKYSRTKIAVTLECMKEGKTIK